MRSSSLNKYAFLENTSRSLTIFEDKYRIIEFGGFTEENKIVSMKIWVKNSSGSVFQAYIQNLIVDEKIILKRKFIEMVDSEDCWQCIKIPISCIDVNADSSYKVKFGIVLLTIKGNLAAVSERVNAILDFSDKLVDIGIENPN